MEEIAGKLIEFGKASFEAAAQIAHAAERTGIAVDSLSKLKYVADQADVEFGALTLGIKRYQVTLSQAASGSSDAASALKLIGLSASQLKSLSLEEQLKKIADQFQRIRDPADQTRVAVALFGRSGEQLVPLLKKGGAAIADLTAEADKLGITLTENTIGAVDRADKALKSLLATIGGAGQRAIGNIALAIMGPKDDVDAASATIDKLLEQRKMLAESAKSAGSDAPAWFQKINADAVAKVNAQLEIARGKLEALKKAAEQSAPPELKIPDTSPITEVIIKAQKQNNVGLGKLLQEFNDDTKDSLEKADSEYELTFAKLQTLLEAGAIGSEVFLDRLAAATIKYQEAIEIKPIDINSIEAKKVVVTKVLSEQQRAVDKFVDTLKGGLENLAQSGEITGRSILKYLLSAFEAQVLKDAIDGVGRYLKQALGGASGSSPVGSSIGSLIDKLFGSDYISPVTITQTPVHAAGGGSMSGPRIVGEDGPELDLGGGSIMNRRQLQFAMAGGGSQRISIGDTNIVVQGSADQQTLAAMQVLQQQSQKKLLEQLNARLKDNYGRALR